MSGNIDLFLRIPAIAELGQKQLQLYCDEWLKRPIAREYGVSHLIVGSNLLLTVNLDLAKTEFRDDRVFAPINELLYFIIEQHFRDRDTRRDLYEQVAGIRKQWGEIGVHYEAMGGRVGNLWLKCKNPSCDVSLETRQQAVEGQVIHCPPCQATCPACGHVDWYDGGDLHLRLT